MRKIIKYLVVAHENNIELTVSVTNLIADGWQPLGGPCRGDGRMHQAMVRYETDVDRVKVKLEHYPLGNEEVIGVVAIDWDDFKKHVGNRKNCCLVGHPVNASTVFDAIEWTKEVRRIEYLKTLSRRQTKPNTLPEKRP